MTLTDAEIRAARPTEKPRKLFDGGGLYLLINPDGSRWWRVKYRYAWPIRSLRAPASRFAASQRVASRGVVYES